MRYKEGADFDEEAPMFVGELFVFFGGALDTAGSFACGSWGEEAGGVRVLCSINRCVGSTRLSMPVNVRFSTSSSTPATNLTYYGN